jgi:LemA protein
VIALIVVAVVVVLVFFHAISVHNGLVRRRNQVDNACSQIDVQLERRYHLIPDLVATVKGYASDEEATLEAVTRRGPGRWSRRARHPEPTPRTSSPTP